MTCTCPTSTAGIDWRCPMHGNRNTSSGAVPAPSDEPVYDEWVEEVRALWLSRLMFNPFVGWPAETRSFEEFCAALAAHKDAK